MTRHLLLFVFLLCISCCAISQDLSKLDTGKYRIDLPDYWKPGNSIWSVLNDKLPLVCEELKDKQLCGDDCNPKYIVAFEMTRPVINDSYFAKVKTPGERESWKSLPGRNYNFQASLLLQDNNGIVLTRFIIVDTNEVWMLYTKNAGKLQAKIISQDIAQPATASASSSSQPFAFNSGDNRRDPLPIYSQRDYIIYEPADDADIKEVPTLTDLFIIFDRKIKAWKK